MPDPRDRVDAILRRTLGVAPRDARLLGGGQSDVYAVSVRDTDDYFLKLSRGGEAWRVAREALVYPLLRCPRPTVVAIDVDEGFLLTATAGPLNLARRFKTSLDCSSQFRAMGRLLRAFHETPLDGASAATLAALEAGRAAVESIVWRDAAGRFTRVANSRPHAARWPAFEAIIRRAIARPGRALLHGDYNTRQVILDAAGDVSATLDFEYACLGPPALDLMRMEFSGIRGRDDFYAGYGSRDPADATLFAVLDALHAAHVARDANDAATHAATVARLHGAIDAADHPPC